MPPNDTFANRNASFSIGKMSLDYNSKKVKLCRQEGEKAHKLREDLGGLQEKYGKKIIDRGR